jgi:hypothetical protein
MDGAGTFRGYVAGHPAGKGKLGAEFLHARFVLCTIRVNFRISTLQVRATNHGLPGVTGAREIDHLQLVPFNDLIEVNVDEILPRRRPPVTE